MRRFLPMVPAAILTALAIMGDGAGRVLLAIAAGCFVAVAILLPSTSREGDQK